MDGSSAVGYAMSQGVSLSSIDATPQLTFGRDKGMSDMNYGILLEAISTNKIVSVFRRTCRLPSSGEYTGFSSASPDLQLNSIFLLHMELMGGNRGA